LVKFFQPLVIAEVGTFIGVSTKVMDEALKDYPRSIFTCDSSNDIQIYKDNKHIIQYRKQTSTQMFKDLADKSIGVDLMYLDGRIQDEDLQYFPQIIHDQTVFVFDDFEGIEKGVVNAMRLNGANRILIYPREGRKTAVSLPFTLLQFVPQEAT
jgi:predicted O-methyltransferase YrrM